jgi:regulator of nucleoside diphosphate kinase
MDGLNMNSQSIIVADQDYERLVPLLRDHPLMEELGRAIVVPAEQIPPETVRINSRVTYVDESSGVSRSVELVFPEDADVDAGKISVLAPVGSALLGLSVGDTIDWPFPNGQDRRLKVVSTTPPDSI